jgi:hypothetical protein
MILLNHVIQVLVGPDERLSGQYAFDLQFGDGLMGRLTAVERVVLQKTSRDTKMLNDTSAQAATLKRLSTNRTCPRMSHFPIPSTWPFRIIFVTSYPPMVRRAVLKLKKSSPGLTRRFMNR